MSVQDILNNAILDGGQAPTNAASATGDHGQMLLHAMARLEEIVGTTNIAPTADASGSLAERLAYLQQVTPLAGGVVRDVREWAGVAGYEYWYGNLREASGTVGHDRAHSATNPLGLDGYGWSIAAGSIGAAAYTGNFLTGGANASFAPATDAFGTRSPKIFGGEHGAKLAKIFLGQMPTKLTYEFGATWPSIGTNTAATYIGLASGAGIPALATSAGSLALIYSNGTNWVLASDNYSDTGAVADTSFHVFRIEVTASGVEWFIDDTSQGSISLETGVFPVGVYIKRDAAGNSVSTPFGRVFYSI